MFNWSLRLRFAQCIIHRTLEWIEANLTSIVYEMSLGGNRGRIELLVSGLWITFAIILFDIIPQ